MEKKLSGEYPSVSEMLLPEKNPINQIDPMEDLSARITSICEMTTQPVILMIDEVDRASDFDVFISFLGMMREKYLDRSDLGDRSTFHNVILAGVHDIKNLKMKIRPESEHATNSPWNIAKSFDVDMSFSPDEIATMLQEYESDHHTGMNIQAVSEHLFKYTSGYPFLVSLLCQYIHDGKLSWSKASVDTVATRALTAQNTLFDDVIKNLQNHQNFARLVERIVLEGKQVAYNPDDPNIQLGMMYGIFGEKSNQVQISNMIFSTRIMNYFISISETGELAQDRSVRDASIYIRNGMLDFDIVLERFSIFMADEYRNQDSVFIEREARRLLIGYIKPIINGQGHYFLEPEIRGGQKIDLLVQYRQSEYIIEVKIWHGAAYEQKAYDQIARYVKARRQQVGYVVSFCNLQHAPRQNSVFAHEGVEIHEVVVAYRDKV